MTAQSEDTCEEKSSPDNQEDPEVCRTCNGTGFIVWVDDNGCTFAEPCECREKMLMKRRLSFAELPEKFKNDTLKTFSISAYSSPKSKEIARQACKGVNYYLNNFDSLKTAGMGLYIHSNTKGTGKTRMAASVANHIMSNTTLQVRFATTTRIITEIKATWDKDREQSESKLLNDLSRVSVLIVDDLGVEIYKKWIEQVFYQIINERYINNLPTIFTSNCGIGSLEYDSRITNRIKEKTFQIAFPEESVREAIMRKNHEELIQNITK